MPTTETIDLSGCGCCSSSSCSGGGYYCVRDGDGPYKCGCLFCPCGPASCPDSGLGPSQVVIGGPYTSDECRDVCPANCGDNPCLGGTCDFYYDPGDPFAVNGWVATNGQCSTNCTCDYPTEPGTPGQTITGVTCIPVAPLAFALAHDLDPELALLF